MIKLPHVSNSGLGLKNGILLWQIRLMIAACKPGYLKKHKKQAGAGEHQPRHLTACSRKSLLAAPSKCHRKHGPSPLPFAPLVAGQEWAQKSPWSLWPQKTLLPGWLLGLVGGPYPARCPSIKHTSDFCSFSSEKKTCCCCAGCQIFAKYPDCFCRVFWAAKWGTARGYLF